MKINIETYNPEWPKQFQRLKEEIHTILHMYEPKIEHFGSTAVPGLPAKPVIDILVGIKDKSRFSNIVDLMLQHDAYIHYQVFDEEVPDRRLFVRLKDGADPSKFEKVMDDFDSIPHNEINENRMAHIHIWEYGCKDWIRHIAFRDYLIAHPEVMDAYGRIKKGLGQKNWSHGMEYNDAKNAFIKEVEAKAIFWYEELS